jgi:hypothetical protein
MQGHVKDRKEKFKNAAGREGLEMDGKVDGRESVWAAAHASRQTVREPPSVRRGPGKEINF